MPSELEKRLRTEARAWSPSCPDTPRQRVLRTLRNSDTRPMQRRWRLPAAAFASAVLAGLIGLAAFERVETPAPEKAAGTQPHLVVDSTAIDRAMASREAALEDELERIKSDLDRIRGWVRSV